MCAIGKEIRVFESGSMMQYLVDRYDNEHKISYPHGSREHVEVRSLSPGGPTFHTLSLTC